MKHFTKKLALLTLLAGLCGSAWAQTTIYERGYDTAWSSADAAASSTDPLNVWVGQFGYNETYGLYASGSGSRSSVLTFSHTGNSLQTFDIVFDNLVNTGDAGNYSYIKIGSDIEIQSNQQNQNGTVIINGSSSSIKDCNQKNYNRGGDKWTIHVEVNTAKNTVTALTIVGETKTYGNNSKYAHYTLESETSLSNSATFNTVAIGFIRVKGSPATALTSIKIAEKAQTVTNANYTINYKFGNSTIKTETGTSTVGATVNAVVPFKVDGQKYYAADDATTSMTLVDGTNELNVNLRKANEYAYSVKDNFGTTLGEGTYIEGEDAINVYWSKYVQNDGKWYECDESTYGVAVTGAVDKTVSYTTVSDIAYFIECENMSKSRSAAATNSGANYSGGYSPRHYASSYWWTDIFEDGGVYSLSIPFTNGNSSSTVISIYTRDSEGNLTDTGLSIEGAARTTGTLTANDIIVPAGYSLVLYNNTEWNSNVYMDYVALVKTADYATVPGTLAASKYATRIFPFTPTVPSGVKFYSCAALNGNSLTLTEVSAPEANKPYILENTTGADIDITQAGVDTHEADTYEAGLLTGVFANTEITSGYVLQTQNEKQSFFKVAEDNKITVPPYRAYLNYSASVKSIGFDSTTAINTLEVLANGAYEGIYTADGVKLNRMEKGVNILKMADGTTRKVIVK